MKPCTCDIGPWEECKRCRYEIMLQKCFCPDPHCEIHNGGYINLPDPPSREELLKLAA
jgi:hypothetical protein